MTRRIRAFRGSFTRNPALTGSRSILAVSVNGLLYATNAAGRLAQVSSARTLTTTGPISAVQRGADELFIADHGVALGSHASNGAVGSGTSKFDAATVSDWTTLGIDTDDYVLVIESATGDLVNGVYAISTVDSGELTTSPACATGTGAATAKWRIVRSSKVYDQSLGTLVRLDATSGNEPVACSMVCQFLDALWWAGDPDNPHVWYKSAQGDGYDYDYTAEGAGVAVAGTSSTDGSPGKPITALVPVGGDYLAIACRDSLNVMRGDPSAGGSFSNLSQTVGIVHRDAWCLGRNGELYFLSTAGVQVLPYGANSPPRPLTSDKLPRELVGLPNDCTVAMAYDKAANGIHLFISSEALGEGALRHWWIDAESGAHFPVSVPSASTPAKALAFEEAVLLGCKDGYIRQFDPSCDTDDGTAISSYVCLGPFMLGDGAIADGMLNELHTALANDGGTATWKLFTGNTAEAAVDAATANSTATWSGTFLAGRSYTEYPRARGVAAVLRIAGTGTKRWGFEFIKAVRDVAGRYRQ